MDVTSTDDLVTREGARTLRTILIAVTALGLAACSQQTRETPAKPAGLGAAEVRGVAPSGSGYADLENTVINYVYEDFGGFNLHVADRRMTWQGREGGYFAGIARQVEPQFSRIADGIYFMSWPTPTGGGDNVVLNRHAMTVNAHLNFPDGAVQLIHGAILCFDQPDCVKPTTELTPPEEVFPAINTNAKRYNMLAFAELAGADRPLSPQDQAARTELTGKTVVYKTAEGTARVSVNDGKTTVSGDGVESGTFDTKATRIADGIYLLSWGSETGGNHLVFDTRSMRVFDHKLADGTRREQIFAITCFGARCGAG
jgi:phenolic acid decarboxylase